MNSENLETSTVYDLWHLHPRGDYFLARGGDKIPPPRQINLGLTNKCNLRCTICGSQGALDVSKTPRQHMPFELFQQIAETMFPFATEVELNSRGEPLLYPQIDEVFEAIDRHKCSFRVQHNGTLLTESMVERLADKFGTLSLSIDAIGPLFDEIRRNGHWEKVEPGLKNLAAKRNKKRLWTSLYPTVMEKNVGQLIKIAQWAHEHELDSVVFHDYDFAAGSPEKSADPDEKKRQVEAVAAFLDQENSALHAYYDSTLIHRGRTAPRDPHPSPLKALHGPKLMNYPKDVGTPYSHETILCTSPWQNIDVGIDGQIAACCRAQAFPFGKADSVEAFADVWFGENYEKLRQSLMRSNETFVCPLPCCAPCIKNYAKLPVDTIQAITYTNNTSTDPRAFTCRRAEFDPIIQWRASQKTNAYFAALPLGLDYDAYTLQEDHTPLGPMASTPDVLEVGNGCYARFNENFAAISSTDNSDFVRNSRRYAFHLKESMRKEGPLPLTNIRHDSAEHYFALVDLSWVYQTVDLFEDGKPVPCTIKETTLYFHTLDESDPRTNGRTYTANLHRDT